MKVSVREAARQVEEAGGLKRLKLDQSDQVIPFVSQLLGRPLPSDLQEFYRENIAEIGEFPSFHSVVERLDEPLGIRFDDLPRSIPGRGRAALQ